MNARGGIWDHSTPSLKQVVSCWISNDSSLLLLLVLRDVLTFVVNCCGITDYWETSVFGRSCPQNAFPFLQNKQFSDYYLQLLDRHLHCWKVSERCIVLCEPKRLCVAALRCDYNFSRFMERSRKNDKEFIKLKSFQRWEAGKLANALL